MASSDPTPTSRWDFLGRTSNIVGSGAGLAALGAGFAATGNPLISLGLAAVGYASGFLLTFKKRASIDIGGSSDTVELATIQQNIADLKATLAEHSRVIPDEILQGTQRIFDTLESILPKWTQIDSFSQDKYTVNAILADYLPRLITSYLSLPRYRTGTRSQVAQEAMEQISILHGALEEISDKLYQGVEADIKVQGIYLKDKFNKANSLNL